MKHCLIILNLFLLLLVAACTPKSDQKPSSLKQAEKMAGEIKPVANLMDPFAEKELGQKLFAQALKTYPLYENTKLSRFINRVGAHVSIPSRRNLAYAFYILDTPEIFSMGLPAGHVLLSRGLLKHVDNESELAGILGVEIANIEQQFFVQSIQNKNNPDAAQAFQLLRDGRFTDGQINTADRLGMTYAQHFGYEPALFNSFLVRLGASLSGKKEITGSYNQGILDHRQSMGALYVQNLAKHQEHFPKAKNNFETYKSLF